MVSHFLDKRGLHFESPIDKSLKKDTFNLTIHSWSSSKNISFPEFNDKLQLNRTKNSLFLKKDIDFKLSTKKIPLK